MKEDFKSISKEEANKITKLSQTKFSSINDTNELIDLLIDNKLNAKNTTNQKELIELKKEELQICSRIAYLSTINNKLM